MRDITILTGDELARFLEVMEAMSTGRERVYQLRITQEDGQVKVKANGRTWTPGMGERDPQCQEALDRAVRFPRHPEPEAQPGYVSRGHLPDGVWPEDTSPL